MIGALLGLSQTDQPLWHPGSMDRSDWVVVLEERQCIDTRGRVSEWRNEFDPGRKIPEEDIVIATYTVWSGPDSLQIWVRSRWVEDNAPHS